MTDKRNESLKKKYYGKKVLVRYQPPLMVNGRMRHCRLIKFIDEEI